MPKLGTELREGADNVEVGVPYEIVNVEDVTTEVSQYAGIRVEMLSAKAKEGSIMLWKRPVTGTGSKLGVFMTLLTDNTDNWLNKWIIFRGWDKGNRLVELTDAPKVKKTKATTAKGVQKAIKKS